jgi:hypothetical protein
MNDKGIHLDGRLSRLREKTTRMMNFFRSVGFNMSGFRERTRLQLYKPFIRPLCEYGLCMMPKFIGRFKLIDKIQNQALCSMFSLSKNTSTSALEVVTHLTDTQHRWNELSFRWKKRTINRGNNHVVIVARNNTKGF